MYSFLCEELCINRTTACIYTYPTANDPFSIEILWNSVQCFRIHPGFGASYWELSLKESDHEHPGVTAAPILPQQSHGLHYLLVNSHLYMYMYSSPHSISHADGLSPRHLLNMTRQIPQLPFPGSAAGAAALKYLSFWIILVVPLWKGALKGWWYYKWECVQVHKDSTGSKRAVKGESTTQLELTKTTSDQCPAFDRSMSLSKAQTNS